MYHVELYLRVRLACHRDGLSQREAARRFGIDRKTVAKILKHSVPPGYQRGQAPKRPKLDPYTGIIDQSVRSWKMTKASRRSSAIPANAFSNGCATSMVIAVASPS